LFSRSAPDYAARALARALQLIEGADGKLDEQALLSILFGMALIFLMVWVVVVQHQPFEPLTFAAAGATFVGGSLGMLTVRSRFSKDNSNVIPDSNSQPSGN
jgi:hypothetical protein